MNTITIKIESQKYLINIDTVELTCKKFIKLALQQSKIEYNKTNNFALFECANGIERLVNKNEIVDQLLSQCVIDNNVEFVIRKCHTIERNLQVFKQQKTSTIKSFYKKAKFLSNKENNFYTIEKKYQEKLIKNDIKLKKTTQLLMESFKLNQDNCLSKPESTNNNQQEVKINLSKLCSQHKNQLNEIISEKYKENVTFLTFLHMKLKQQNNTDSGRDTEGVVGSTGCSRSNSSDDVYNSSQSGYETWV
jgi:hypothetical protein